MIHIFCTFLYV
uniref:Uncharacterized protein n=1 Tax=Anguilla anguilla TaxID=7936 RepID=A0A0E9QS68_ANGAN